MTRESGDDYGPDGALRNGYDYDRQAWVRAGRYERCGHPEAMGCDCYGRTHEGERTPVPAA